MGEVGMWGASQDPFPSPLLTPASQTRVRVLVAR